MRVALLAVDAYHPADGQHPLGRFAVGISYHGRFNNAAIVGDLARGQGGMEGIQPLCSQLSLLQEELCQAVKLREVFCTLVRHLRAVQVEERQTFECLEVC